MKKLFLTVMCVAMLLLSGCASEKTAVIFTTENIVEDYCEDAIIVSNANGKVYGMLDNKGKEILPLNYDNIEFMNKDEYISGENDILYLCAEYEDEYTVMTTEGKEILRTSNYIYTMDFDLDTEITDRTPFFKESTGDKYKLYNKKGTEIGVIPKSKQLETELWINDEVYCYYGQISNGITIYNYKGEKVDSIDAFISQTVASPDKLYAFTLNRTALNAIDENSLQLISIDGSGKISVEKKYEGIGNFDEEVNELREKYSGKKYKLYQSNGTWKVEDLNGNPLYEERYFERLNPSGENDCIGLTDQNDGICIIGRDGTKYVDFGLIYYDEDDESAYMTILEKDEDGEEYEEQYEVREIFEGKESIIIPIKTSEGYDIYYYGK